MEAKKHQNKVSQVNLPTRSLSSLWRKFLATSFVAMLGASAPMVSAFAQGTYPNKPIKFIVASPPGGSTDIIARIAADGLGRKFGVSVIVENKTGATGWIAIDYVAKAPGDGYTLLIASDGNLLPRPFLERNFKFDSVKDIAPVFNMAELPHVLVVPKSVPVKDLAGFIAYGKSNPGKIFYGSPGTGSQTHIAISHLGRLTGMQVSQVPYKGLGSAVIDLVAGRLQVMSSGLGTVRPYLKGGELIPLAVASKKRLTALPDVPTSAEAGLPGWEMSAWFGVFAPKGTEPSVIANLNEKLQSVFDEASTKQKLVDIGAESVSGSAESFKTRILSDSKMYAQLIKDTGIQPE